MIKITTTGDLNFDGDKIIKETLINDIITRVPSAKPYKHLIKVKGTGSKMTADLSALPMDIVKKINEVFG